MSTAPSGSDGIALLRRERPEVLEAYLNLLGSLGKSLDPRTRDAGLKWSLTWIVWLQDLMLTYGFFV